MKSTPLVENRRGFLKRSCRAAISTASAATLTSSAVAAQQHGETPPPAGIYRRMVRSNDARVARVMATGEGTEGAGAAGPFSPRNAAYGLLSMVAAFSAPASTFHDSTELIRRMDPTIRALLSAQYRDGTIDSGNLQSPPDTAFVVEPLCVALTLLNRNSSENLLGAKQLISRFILAAGEALTTGGVHTPNHRWGVCAALARINSLYPASKYVARIEEWLGEGVDIDPDGQFSERSTGIYSRVTDVWLLTLARLLRRDSLLEPVRRNLEMTLYYCHPDGELEILASRRQDQSRRNFIYADRPVPDTFHLPYRYLAIRDHNGRFAAMTRLIEEKVGDQLAGNLAYFQEEPLLQSELPPEEPLPDRYRKYFQHSGIVRIRSGKISATVYGGSDWPLGVASGLASNPTFFNFRKGDAVLESLRLGADFFNKGYFYSRALQPEHDSYRLRQRIEVPYYQPLPGKLRKADGEYPLTPAEDRFWSKMDFPSRSQSNVKFLDYSIRLSQRGNAVEIDMDVHGHDKVPVALELCFRRGGNLAGVSSSENSDEYFLEKGVGRYSVGDDVIEFGPGDRLHRWTRMEGTSIRGTAPRAAGLRVYITWLAPFRKTVTIA